MAFCRNFNFVWIIILYIVFPINYIFLLIFFFKKINCVLEDTKDLFFDLKVQFVDFWLFTSEQDHENQRPVINQLIMINYVKIIVILFDFHCALVHTKNGHSCNSHTWSPHLLVPKFATFSVSEKVPKMRGAMWWVP